MELNKQLGFQIVNKNYNSIANVVVAITPTDAMSDKKWENDEVVQRFREYLKIPSVHPDIDYGDCVKFLKRQALEIGLTVCVHELVPKKPVVVMSWEGIEPTLPALLLNSHMDVVPVYEDKWTHPPFAAHVTKEGWIYARGTQDMKSVGMAHLEAVRGLKSAGVRLKRNVHISFVPDEEIGSVDGMKIFSESEEFRKLNIGFALDESVPHQKPNELVAFHGEKTSRQIKITCRGTPGHGALVEPGSAGEKFHKIIDKFMTLRAQELKKLQAGAMLGDVFSINLTQVEGGVQINVVPDNLSVCFDIRIPPDVDHDEFEREIESWCKEAGENVTFQYIVKNPEIKSTKIEESAFWNIIQETVKKMGMSLTSIICPGATDARFTRRQGIPAINLTTFDNTPLLIHGHDERIQIDTYKKGIDVMEKIVQALADYN